MTPHKQSATGQLDDFSGIVRAMANVIRFRDVRPNTRPGDDGNPAWATMFKYTDGRDPGLGRTVPAACHSDEFRLACGVVEPEQGAPLHSHTGEELMFSVTGTWLVFFDEEERHSVLLEPWDAILIPPGVKRGWRNVGHEAGFLLNLNGTADRMISLGLSPSC